MDNLLHEYTLLSTWNTKKSKTRSLSFLSDDKEFTFSWVRFVYVEIRMAFMLGAIIMTAKVGKFSVQKRNKCGQNYKRYLMKET